MAGIRAVAPAALPTSLATSLVIAGTAITAGAVLGVSPIVGSNAAHAQPLPEADVPAPLRPWVDWVLRGDRTHECAWMTNERECRWPGQLTLELREGGARFTLEVEAGADVNVRLPGGPGAFPLDVRVGGREVPLRRDDQGIANVWLARGSHRITGHFELEELPELFLVPQEIAVVRVTRGGRAVAVRRNDVGDLWLRARETETTETEDDQPDGLSLEVMRHVQDGSPFQVESQITVRASGRAREVVLGRAVLEGMTPTELRSDLAARLDPETGELRVQARPGTFTIRIRAQMGTPPETLEAPDQPDPWPEEERWVWQPDERLRQVAVAGAPSLDRARTSVPSDWEGSVYALSAGQALSFTTSRRGESTPAPNQLDLNRELWLDFDGGGFTARDRLSGRMSQGYRLDLLEGELGRVSILGVGDQVITELEGNRGVEIRDHDFAMEADVRFSGTSSIPAVGWSEDMGGASATLHLPPGWVLLSARGVDTVSGTWLEQWNLWSIFFVLVMSLAIGRLATPKLGVLALVALTLCYHESGAPFLTWILLLPLLGLRRVIPAGPLQKVSSGLFWSTVVLLLWVSLPFATSQLRNALYPFMADADAGWVEAGYRSATLHETWDEETPEWLEEAEFDDYEGGGRGKRHRGDEGQMGEAASSRSSNRYAIEGPTSDDPHMARESAREATRNPGGSLEPLNAPRDAAGWVDPNAIAQTGPGVPTWAFHAHELRWNGPVLRGQVVSLTLLPPWLFRLLALLRVGLLAGLILLLLVRHVPTPPGPKPATADDEDGDDGPEGEPSPPQDAPETPSSGSAQVVGATAVLVAFSLFGAGGAFVGTTAHAQVPNQAALDALAERLTAEPECSGECVLVSDASLTLGPDGELTVELEVHAGAQVGVPLPGPATHWVPESVRVDGRPTTALLRSSANVVHVRVDAGVHRITLTGPVRGDALTLALGTSPSRTQANLRGWAATGIRPDGSGAETLELRRTVPRADPAVADPAVSGEPDAALGETQDEREAPLPVWAIVERRLELGVRWTLHTVVRRHGDESTGQATLRLPLLEGESVTADSVQVEDGVVLARVPHRGDALRWTSTLEPGSAIGLEASEGQHTSEVWVLACSPMWRCAPEGLTPTSRGDHEVSTTYHPWPGETLAITATQPPGAEGSSRTIQDAALRLTPGVRSLAATLEMTVRASQGDTQAVVLPAGAEVQSLSVRGRSRPVQLDDEGRLEVNVPPGESAIRVEWRQAGGLGLVFASPEVGLRDEIVNASIDIDLPHDRWVLWAWGPASGVAVLFWPYLLLVFGLAFVLARTKRTPLKLVDWFLLGIGLTQIPPLAGLCVIGWFFAIDLRGRTPDIGRGLFVVRQISLAFYSLIAAVCLYAALHVGLLMQPDMQVASVESGANQLAWYLDRAGDTMPPAGVLSAPLWVWRVLILAWALWLAVRLFSWGKWGWTNFARGGWFKGGIAPPAPAPRTAAPEPAAPGASGVAPHAAPGGEPEVAEEGTAAGLPDDGEEGEVAGAADDGETDRPGPAEEE